MEQHLITIDLDGTLLLSFMEYDQETINYLKKLHNEGHLIMIATGRPFRSSYFIYEMLGLKTPIINYNGALVTNPSDHNFKGTDLRINRSELFDILNYADNYLINVFSEIHDDIYVQDYNSSIHSYLHTDGGVLHEGRLQDNLPENPNGAILFVKEEFVKPLAEYVKQKYPNTLYSRYWGENEKFHIVEIYNKHVNKGEGLKQAMDYYHIPKNRVIAIGDGHNDIEMFTCAGIKVAMKNAHKDLTPHATFITDTNKEQGVLKFLKKYFNLD